MLVHILISLCKHHQAFNICRYDKPSIQSKVHKKVYLMLDFGIFTQGCPSESIVLWLNDIFERIPCAKTSARFYTTKAAVIKDSLDIDAVLQVFEDATINNAQVALSTWGMGLN